METSRKHILQTYLRRLTNLSGNSRSLLLLRLASDQFFDVQQLSFLKSEKSFSIIESLIAGKSKKICAIHDSRMEAVNEASRKLKKLERIDKFIFEERGSNDLHIGWPFVRGKFSDGTLVRCPLLFFPVTVCQDGTDWILKFRKDAGLVFNKTFLLAYAFYNRTNPSEELLDTSFDDFDMESVGFRTQLYQLLKDKIEINFNPDTYSDELIKFEEFKRDDFDETHRNGELKLFSEAVLGIFPQAGSQLVPDYLKLIDDESFIDFEEFFDKRMVPELAHVSPWSVKEEKIFAPFQLDAYQEQAIRLIKTGKSIVVQGPPGTGKSQLICNLLSDAIASGKKALLVCQKRVALDVVFDRLRKIELGDFLGLIHDFRNDRKSIYEKIARQINKIEEYKSHNRSIDSIQLERRFLHVCREIDQVVEELEEFRKYLFDEEECGLSIKELYLTSNPHEPTVNLKQEYQFFNFSTLSDFITKMKFYVRYAEVLEDDNHPWNNRKSFSQFQVGDLQTIEKTIKDIADTQEQIQSKLKSRIGSVLSLEDCENLLGRQKEVEEMLALLKDELIWERFRSIGEYKDDETSLLWLQNMERVVLNCFEGTGVETSLASSQIGACQTALHQRMVARKSLFRFIRWELFSEHKFFLKRVLITNGLIYNKAGLQALEIKLDNRLNLEHHLTALRGKPWLADLPSKVNRQEFKDWFQIQKRAVQAKLIFSSLRELRKVLNVQRYTLQKFGELLREIFAIIGTIPFHRDDWKKYLSTYQIRNLVHDPSLGKTYVDYLKRDFDTICEYDRLKESLSAQELSVISKLYDATQSWDFFGIEKLFQNSIRITWIEHIEVKHPILRSVSTHKMEELESVLQSSVEEKNRLSKEITLMRARERVYENMQYNRLNNPTTYRDLLHQATKKKKIWPVRKVITEFQSELFDLIPCWLASPESVSALFPMKNIFDLVIFDEASQCFSERGIPAMFRGKQVLVAGDSMQLKPFELYQVRWDEESENPDLEIDSLLELTERYIPTVHLQGHYRSRSMDLINFSNQHFYGNRLQMIPDKKILNRGEPALHYLKVEGEWDNQTNEVEAKEVVNQIVQYIKESPEKEIGVVTFNAPQQMLIMDMLDELITDDFKIPSTLFVKNIENVQGDEKDIIIFSIGYAPDKRGKLKMQFGSLNAAGGEHRLNVAVTRAREKVIVVTSVWPEQLKVQDSMNEGPKLLRSYLEYVRGNGKNGVTVQGELKQNNSWYFYQHLQENNLGRKENVEFIYNQLPQADLVVNDKQQSLGIILTDDLFYKNNPSVKESEVYVPFLLAEKNWKQTRYFSRAWWMSREKVETDLMKFIYSIKSVND